MDMPAETDAAIRVREIVRWVGMFGGPLLAILAWATLPTAMAEPARATAAAAVWMGVWWMTSAIPLPATALLPLLLFPLLGVADVAQAAAPYANKYVFLFLGGFLLALAIERSGLHRRFALAILSATGTEPARLVGGFMLASALLSMWISNTATTVMLLPLALGVLRLLANQASERDREHLKALGPALLLGVAYAASIGGLGTLIGTPPNTTLAGYMYKQGIPIDFARWMLLGVPLAATYLVLAWLLLTQWLFRAETTALAAGDLIREQREQLEPMSRREWIALTVFLLVALAWLSRGALQNWDWLVARLPLIARIDDTMIAIGGALLLFAIPVDIRRGEFALDWTETGALPWGVLLIHGGGFSLAMAIQESGLNAWIGEQFLRLEGLPPLLLATALSAGVIFLTELTSNTATAATLIPILYEAERSLELAPGTLLLPATLAASCAFMLPAATPPNAIVFGSGEVPIEQMIRAGFWLNLLGIVLIPLFVWLLGGWVL